MIPVSARKARKAVCQPWSTMRCCATGATMKVPKEPIAETIPNTVLREASETVRAVADKERFEAVQDSARPMKIPVPSNKPSGPVAKIVVPTPAAKQSVPLIIKGLTPKRSPIAPMKGWVKPQTIF